MPQGSPNREFSREKDGLKSPNTHESGSHHFLAPTNQTPADFAAGRVFEFANHRLSLGSDILSNFAHRPLFPDSEDALLLQQGPR